MTRQARLKTQIFFFCIYHFFNDSDANSIELANKNKVFPTVTNLRRENNFAFKGHKLHSLGLTCHYQSLSSWHLILANLHSASHSWATAVHRTSHRYMDLFIMNKNLDKFIRTKAKSVLWPGILVHLVHDAINCKKVIHLFIGHNSVNSCRHIDLCTDPLTVPY